MCCKEKVEDLLNTVKAVDLLKKKDEEPETDKKCKGCIKWILIIIGAVAVIAGIAYAVYKFFAPDYLEDFEDDFDDDFEDDEEKKDEAEAEADAEK